MSTTNKAVDNTASAIKALTQAVEAAQAVLVQLKATTTPEGWLNVSATGGEPITAYAPRHGCAWNTKEDRDLVTKWFEFSSTESLSRIHRRTEGGVRSRLQHLLHTADMSVLLSAICGSEE